jgi:hypothetical protein
MKAEIIDVNKKIVSRRDVWEIIEPYEDPNWPGEYVYVIRCNGEYKIGKSCEITERLRALRVKHRTEIDVLMLIKTKEPHLLENLLHYTFRDKRSHDIDYFKLEPGDLDTIKRVVKRNKIEFIPPHKGKHSRGIMHMWVSNEAHDIAKEYQTKHGYANLSQAVNALILEFAKRSKKA